MLKGIKISMNIDLSDSYIYEKCVHYSGKGYSYYFGNDYIYGYTLDELRQNVINHFTDNGFTIEKFQ